MSQIKEYPISIPVLSGNEAEYVKQCMDTGFISSVGKFVDEFEDLLAAKSHYKYAVAVSSGTIALSLAQYICNVEHNDLVAIPDYTFIATANSVFHNKAHPWLHDIEEPSLNLDIPKFLESTKKNASYKKGYWVHNQSYQKLKSVIPVLALGNSIDFDALSTIREEIGVPIILDAAGALGAKFNNLELGSSPADIACISFNGNKTFTSGGGGALLTNDQNIYHKAKHISTTARLGFEYIHDFPGFNYRMTNVEAAIGYAQLEQYEKFLSIKKSIYNYYLKNLNFNGCLFYDSPNSSHWLSYFILNKSNISLEKFYEHCNKNNIYLRPFWVPMHLQPPYKDAIFNDVSISKKLFKHVVTLPSSTNLKENDLSIITETVIKALELANE